MKPLRELRERLARGGVVLLDQALVSVASLLATVFLVRALGLEGFGSYALLAIVVTCLQSLQQAWIGTPMLTLGPKQAEAQDGEYWAAAARLQGQLLVVALALGGLVALPIVRMSGLPIGVEDVALVAFAGAGRTLHDFVRQSGFARGRTRWVLGLDALGCTLHLGALAALLAARALTPAGALLALGSSSLAAALLGLATFGSLRCSRAAVRRAFARHSGMGRWLVALALTQWFTSNAFAVSAGIVLGPAAIGAIKAGQTVLGVQHVFLLAAESTVPVHAARLAAQGRRAELRAYFRRVAAYGGGAALLLSAAVAAVPRPIAALLYGRVEPDTLLAMQLAIRVFALHYLVVFAVGLVSMRLRTDERTRPIFLASALGAVAAACAATPVVQAFGLPGALLGTVLQQALVLLILLLALGLGDRVRSVDQGAADAHA